MKINYGYPYLFTIVCFVILIFTSCDINRVYDTSIKINNRSWDEKNKLKFSVQIEDTTLSYNMYINIRNTNQYRYSNLYIFMNTNYPQQYFERDTLQFNLATDEGKWMGNGLGDLFYNQVLFKSNFRFPQKGMYQFELQQGMRDNPLTGIADVGIRVEKNK